MILFNIITIAAILFHGMDYWNYFASWLAVQIEWVVGTYMFGQTGRDAVIMRKIARIVEHIEKTDERVLKDIEGDHLAPPPPAVHYSESGQAQEVHDGTASDCLPQGEHSEARGWGEPV